MAQFRKKPVVIEAVQWDGTFMVAAEIVRWAGAHTRPDPNPVSMTTGNGVIYIDTLEGQMRCNEGDWIIRGVKGEFYPCKNDIFSATYEPVEGSPVNGAT